MADRDARGIVGALARYVALLFGAVLGLRPGGGNELDENNQPKAHPLVDGEYGREGLPTGEIHQPTDAELKARNKRNLAIALAVVAFVLLIYFTTFLRLAQNLSAGTVN